MKAWFRSMRKRSRAAHEHASGYTIIEVIIFMAITMALFTMIVVTFNGQQGRTNFSTAARDMESRMQDILNDISTGYYARPQNFQCQTTPTGPRIIPSAGPQGGDSEDCIFIGRVAHFNISGAGNNRFYVYTVAGLRQTAIGTRRDVRNFGETMPRAISPLSPDNAVDLTEKLELPGGMTFGRMYYQPPAGPVTDVAGIGLFSSYGSYSGGSLQPGALQVSLIPFGTGARTEADMVGLVNGLRVSNPTGPGNSPTGRFTVCLNSGTSNQHADLIIGGDSRQLSTDMEIREGAC